MISWVIRKNGNKVGSNVLNQSINPKCAPVTHGPGNIIRISNNDKRKASFKDIFSVRDFNCK